MQKKAVLLDSSSAILLDKAELLNNLLESYHVIICEAVYLELTENFYPSAALFENMVLEGRIEVQKLMPGHAPDGRPMKELFVMGIGERETILQFLAGVGDFIMLDDGKGARFCSKHKIPFINALLFPTILNLDGKMSRNICNTKIQKIKQLGRYSKRILEMAEKLSADALKAFFP